MLVNSIKTKNNFHNYIVIKQSDNTSAIEILLCGANGSILSDLNQSCTLTILDEVDQLIRQKTTEQIVNGTVTFRVANDLKTNPHTLEITTSDGQKFPSNHDFKIFVSYTHDESELRVINNLSREEALAEIDQSVKEFISENTEEYIDKVATSKWLYENNFKPKDAVATFNDLPKDPELKELRGVIDENAIYIYDGSEWIKQSQLNFDGLDKMNEKLEQINVNVKDYGAAGDGMTDDTQPIIRAMSHLAEGGTLLFPTGEYKVFPNIINIEKSMNIVSKGATLIHAGDEPTIHKDAIFYVNRDIDFLSIEGFSLESLTKRTQVRMALFANGKYDKSEEFNVKNLVIKNNFLKHFTVVVYGKETIPLIENNRWLHDASIENNKGYLIIDKGLQTNSLDKRYGLVRIVNNTFDVYPAASDNFDIIKVSGACKGAILTGNYIRNNNTNTLAQIDLYTGGDAARFTNNILFNTGFVRKEVGTALTNDPDGTINLDFISGNYFEVEKNFASTLKTLFDLRGTFFSIINNQIKYKGESDGFVFNVHPETNEDDPENFNLSNNMIDAKGSNITIFNLGAVRSGFGVVVGNLVAGGGRFITNTPRKTVVANNIWNNENKGIFGNVGEEGILLGNISNDATSNNYDISGKIKNPLLIYETGISTTIDNSSLSRFKVRGGGNIEDFSNKGDGKTVTLIGYGTSATVIHSNKIRLKGATNVTIPLRGFISFEYLDDTWVEVSRNF